MDYCPQCEASLTETDLECGRCTQCGFDLIADDDDFWDDEALQFERELRREELSK